MRIFEAFGLGSCWEQLSIVTGVIQVLFDLYILKDFVGMSRIVRSHSTVKFGLPIYKQGLDQQRFCKLKTHPCSQNFV